METIETRVGIIVDGDNRFFGRSAFTEWAAQIKDPGDALLVALGLRELTPMQREVARLVSLCLMSPDARVWPLKLTRLLASHGDPLVGYFGGQLVSAGRLMGPGAGTGAALGLVWVAGELGEDHSEVQVAAAVAGWRAKVGRFGGFGVPFRELDERRVAVLRMAGEEIVAGRYWRLHEQVVRAMAPQRPNCALTFAAMLLDAGVAAEEVGVAMAALMGYVFLAHALEAAKQDGARLHTLPVERVVYRGAPRRDSRDGRGEWVVPAGLRREE